MSMFKLTIHNIMHGSRHRLQSDIAFKSWLAGVLEDPKWIAYHVEEGFENHYYTSYQGQNYGLGISRFHWFSINRKRLYIITDPYRVAIRYEIKPARYRLNIIRDQIKIKGQ